MSNFNLNKSIELLQKSPVAYAALFKDSQYNWDSINEGPETWSAHNIIGHLIHGERTDWIPRAEIILGTDSKKTFEPYDRFAQDRLYASSSTDDLLQEFKSLRVENLEKLISWNLTELDLDKEGIHPELGLVSLRQLIATWTIHDMVHLNQISRVLIKHYAEEIGPWKNYVNLLK